jgi:hypothetical protein
VVIIRWREYEGRLGARLAPAVRLIVFKADGSVAVHSDAKAYKPLNWMNPPCTVSEAEATAALLANNVIVVAMNSEGDNGGIDGSNQAGNIATATSGVLVNDFASVPIGNLVATIVDAIGSVTSTVDLSFFHTAAAGLGVSFVCTDALGCTDVPGGATRTFDVTFSGLTPGIYDFIVGARGVSATEADRICVAGDGFSCDVVVPEPGSLGLLGLGLLGLGLSRRRSRG